MYVMEPLIHLLLPLTILLVFFPKLEKKYVFGLLFLAVIPDLDFLVKMELHRYLFHNIFFVLIITFLIWILWDKKATIIGFYYLMSHLILDFAEGAIALFWPVYKELIAFVFNLKSYGGFDFDIIWGIRIVDATFLNLTGGLMWSL